MVKRVSDFSKLGEGQLGDISALRDVKVDSRREILTCVGDDFERRETTRVADELNLLEGKPNGCGQSNLSLVCVEAAKVEGLAVATNPCANTMVDGGGPALAVAA